MRLIIALLLSIASLWALDPWATESVAITANKPVPVQCKALVDAWYAAKIKPLPAPANDLMGQMLVERLNDRIAYMDRNMHRFLSEPWTDEVRMATIKAEMRFTQNAIDAAEKHGQVVPHAVARR